MRCYLCGLTAERFNNLKLCTNIRVNEENLTYGICLIHAWIRFTECHLHLAYKLKKFKWQARSLKDKNIVAAEKIEYRSFGKNKEEGHRPMVTPLAYFFDMPKK